jgi:serine/threonine protein kinase
MASDSSVLTPVTFYSLVDQFTREVRRGTAPSIKAYVAKYPQFAEQILDLFPLIADLERCKSSQDAELVRQNFPDEFPLRQLGDYTLVREIGRGGMGIVFEAIHSPTSRTVAIKLLPGRDSKNLRRSKKRFHREAITIARFQHQNIVPVYSFGEHDGYCFYVMQLVQGIGLDRVIKKLRDSSDPVFCSTTSDLKNRDCAKTPSVRGIRRDSWKVFARIGIQVATALTYAHQRDVLHQDIKPANLILNAAGKVVVTDFGGSYRPRTEPCRTTSTTGTLMYLAPERLNGDSDARSDVYSLGATLYELVTRTPLFPGSDRARLPNLVLNAPPTRPTLLEKTLPIELESIILRALSKNPADRYATAKALGDDLLRFVNLV